MKGKFEIDITAYCGGDANLKIPNNVRAIKSLVFSGNKDLENIKFEENSILETIGSSAFSNSNIKKITIPKTVKYIHKFAFNNCANLKTVEFDDNSKLLEIDTQAFEGCNIKHFVIPEGVVKLGAYAFADCKNLETIIIPESLREMYYGVFNGCKKLKIYYKGTKIPDTWNKYWNCNDNFNNSESRCEVVIGYKGGIL